MPIDSDEEEYERLQAGPDAPDGIQVGYLPLSFADRPTDTRPSAAPTRSTRHYQLVPQIAFCIRYFMPQLRQPRRGGQDLRADLRPAGAAEPWTRTRFREIYQGYALPAERAGADGAGQRPGSPRQRSGAAAAVRPGRGRATGGRTAGTPAPPRPYACARAPGPAAAGAGIPAGTGCAFCALCRGAAGADPADGSSSATTPPRPASSCRLPEIYGSVLVAEDGPCAPTPDNPCLWELSCWNGGWVYHHPTGEILFQTGAGGNFGHYTDPRADELIARVVTTTTSQVLTRSDYIAEQVPVIFTPNFPLRLSRWPRTCAASSRSTRRDHPGELVLRRGGVMSGQRSGSGCESVLQRFGSRRRRSEAGGVVSGQRSGSGCESEVAS